MAGLSGCGRSRPEKEGACTRAKSRRRQPAGACRVTAGFRTCLAGPAKDLAMMVLTGR
ncbi:hypothetical protein LHK_02237 [Laribacter hongkongensis HLHK9]|uniref:Uncharacterized protein n=1 Tax=Laribacter hongkongensis (strain HLHK9) TaxID=557598 RepID=C1DAA6_LARHH|nr:hypothetical protein LHK_02237 [Laribacter hongkongensis HLHK9]